MTLSVVLSGVNLTSKATTTESQSIRRTGRSTAWTSCYISGTIEMARTSVAGGLVQRLAEIRFGLTTQRRRQRRP
ncbi:unnamed protein product [Symbiodinium natans]|uniref:Uncharacterized protein n=1 Tax=Symbiodinium natans TaxID=878477 RepID=A0A812KV26_9DINO|nr:unnamed protein product [Symbiodinium natans]